MMNWKVRYVILGADLMWITIDFMFAHVLRITLAVSRADFWQFADVPAILVASSIWAILYFRKELEGFRGGWYFPSVFAQVVVGVFYLMSCLLALAFLLNHPYSQLATFYFGCLLLLGFTIIRCLAWWLVISRSNARAKRRVVILGRGPIVDDPAPKICRPPEMWIEIAGVFSAS